MGTLKQIAIALESIANDLHILVANTNKRASSQQMGTNYVRGKARKISVIYVPGMPSSQDGASRM